MPLLTFKRKDMNKKNIVAGNWKMNLGPKAAIELAQSLKEPAASCQKTEVWVAPAFPSLSNVIKTAAGSTLKVGAQNVHWEEKGAFTGEASVSMLKELGCNFAIVGHSERRHIFGESDEMVSKRCLAALNSGLPVILCIGETLAQREASETTSVLIKQLEAVTNSVNAELSKLLTIAYEPVWAIGTGKVASIDEIADAHDSIDKYWQSVHGDNTPPILYGGSVSPDNFAEIIKVDRVSGALVGGASLSTEKFSKLIAISEEC